MTRLSYPKLCNPQKLSRELAAAGVDVATIQASPTEVTIVSEGDASIVAAVVARHVYEPVTLGRRRQGT